MLCPVREADWIEDLNPDVVFSNSGIEEPDCVFLTGRSPDNAIWYITRHEQESSFVEMTKITPNVTACRLTIQLHPWVSGSTATITYTHMSLGPEGDASIDAFTEDYYIRFMRDWEAQINHYLSHGSILHQ